MAALVVLKQYSAVPDALLECGPDELNELLGGPSLFFLDGVRSPPLFITVLQHGNEPTGFDAIQKILQKYQYSKLPRSVWLFIANVEAAEQGLRTLTDQNDFNRAWPGTAQSNTAEAALMAQVVDIVTANPLFASIDIHNNTGCNPHYGCINKLDTPFLHLAALFARTTVFFQQPLGVQSLAMAAYCPAVTLECGQAGENAALNHACEYIDACLHMHHLPEHTLAPHDIHLLSTEAVVKMRPGFTFGFEGEAADVIFRADLDRFNFGLLEKDKLLGRVCLSAPMPIFAMDNDGNEISGDLFELCEGQLRMKRSIIPSMATLDIGVIRQDCLFYVMKEIALSV